MITSREVGYATYGAWRLARADPQGMQFFDNTPEAFWRSFHAATVAAPIYVVLVVLQLAERPVTGGPFRVMSVEAISYAIDWVAFPLVMFYIAQSIGRFDRYLRYIAAYNWSKVLQMSLWLAVAAITQTGLLPRGAGIVVELLAMVAILTYQWFIARIGLEVRGLGAASIVLLDLVISFFLSAVTMNLLQASPG